MQTCPVPTFEILRVGYYHHTVPRSSDRIVDTYILELFRTYTGTMTIGGECLALRPNLMVFAKPGERRASMAPFECYFVHFQVLNDSAFEKRLSTLPSVYHDIGECDELAAGEIIGLFNTMRSGFIREDGLTAGIKLAELITRLELLAAEAGRCCVNNGEKEAVMNAVKFIRAHTGDKINLADMAASVHLSPNYFHTLFRRVTGETPAAMLTRLRMEDAKELLLTSALPIGQIAERCGFDSQTYFASVFRRQIGVTPSEYRERGIF
ncbi:MAG: helix-turn-helix transcriptional regulator [Clostridia bacterium]|nr:helix-turn-helix transcriptional regulator [Clostridia bacterium]